MRTYEQKEHSTKPSYLKRESLTEKEYLRRKYLHNLVPVLKNYVLVKRIYEVTIFMQTRLFIQEALTKHVCL